MAKIFNKAERYVKQGDEYKLLSYATSSESVEMTDGTNLQTTMDNKADKNTIDAIVDTINDCAPKYIEMPTDEGIAWVAGDPHTRPMEVAYGNGIYVCVDDYDISYSTDGIDWNGVSSTVANDLYAGVIYANGKFVAINSNGSMHYSTDGINWTAGTISSNVYSLTGITYGNGKFVVIDYNGNAYYSTDGISWTAGGEINEDCMPGNIAYGNGKFVTFNDEEGDTYYSTDGISWTAGGVVIGNIHGVVYGNDKFVAYGAGGDTFYSTDGINWTVGGTAGNEYVWDIAYGDGKFVAISYEGGGVYYSMDGIEWAAGDTTGANELTSISYANKKFMVTAPDEGMYISTSVMKDFEMEEVVNDLSLQVQKIASHVGQVIHSTTLDTMEKVISIYGGTRWEKIEGMFLLGQSSAYAVNSTGGVDSITLDEENLPSHTHTISHTHTTPATATGNQSANHTHTVNGGSVSIASSGDHEHNVTRRNGIVAKGSDYAAAQGTENTYSTTGGGAHTHTVPAHTHTVGNQSASHTHTLPAMTTNSISTSSSGSVGSGTAITNMPPYKTVYIWERTA